MFLYLSRIDREEDRQKFKRIYQTYRLKMQYTATQILKDENEAENMVHETFLTLTDHLDKIDEQDSHKTWNYIVTILKNKCFNYLKRNRKVQYLADTAEKDGVSGGGQSDIADGAGYSISGGRASAAPGRGVFAAGEETDLSAVCARRETIEILAEEIRKLKYPYKEILYLSYYNEMTSAQIGATLDMSAENVRQTLRRAKTKLKKALEQRGVTA